MGHCLHFTVNSCKGGCKEAEEEKQEIICNNQKDVESRNKSANTITEIDNSNSKCDLQPHPVKEQLPGIDYCVNSPPPRLEALILGFQHYVLSLGMIVLISSTIVPQMGGGNYERVRLIQTSLFVSGLNTMLQSFFGTRLPAVIGGSYAYVLPTAYIILSSKYNAISDPSERFKATMRGLQGSLMMSACFQMVLGFLGLWRNIVRFTSPLSVAPYITCTGLGLYHLGFPMLVKCFEVGFPALFAIVFISQYIPQFIRSGRSICERYAVLFTIPIIWLYAQVLTSSGVYKNKAVETQISCCTDRSGLVGSAPWVYIPFPFRWGSPTFDAREAFVMMAAACVSAFESTGTFCVTARYGGATPVPPSVLGRGVGWMGIGVLLSAIFGSATGVTASVENAGLLGLTKVGSRRVVQISATFMIFFSVFGKFGAVIASIPLPIIASLYCIFFSYVASAGLGFLQFCNMNSFRTKFILGFSFFMCFSVPQYFKEQTLGSEFMHMPIGASWVKVVLSVIFMSSATVAALVAILLDCSICPKCEATRNDSNLQWWERFNVFCSDLRSDDFYALPCRLNKFFPAL